MTRLPPLREGDAAIVAAYRELGTLKAAGERFGITREGARQGIARYERLMGETVQRVGHLLLYERLRAARVVWRCRDCGEERKVSKSLAARVRCTQCARKLAGSRFRKQLSDELIEDTIDRVLRGERFYPLAIAAGYSVRATHCLTAGVYRHLLRRGDAGTISRIWPRGVPPSLVNKFGPPPMADAA